MFPRAWTVPSAPWIALGLAAAGVVAVALFVDLAPRVEGEFFFSEDDPQLRETLDISGRFPSSPQAILRVQDTGDDPEAYRARVAGLTRELEATEGVTGVYSIATDDPRRSPLFRRVLLTPDPAATNVVLQTEGTDPEVLVPRLEAVVELFDGDGLDVVMSGVPVIVELIRRSLFHDLVIFSLSALAVFAVLIAVAYRDAAVVVGTLATCLISVAVTLLLTRVFGVAIGLLTANLVTIVFVLTLSHLVFLTANWRRAAAAEPDRSAAVAGAIRLTLEGSFWSMATTLLGFLSLLLASARPLRELGVAGALGTVSALVVAYAVYPAFLGPWVGVPEAAETPSGAEQGPVAPAGRAPVVAVAIAVFALGAGLLRVDTDPGLLTYFARGTPLREGLERVDADGGSSTLDVVVRDAGGRRIDQRAVFDELGEYQTALEADSAVGVVLSPRVLLEHARAQPLAGFLSLRILLDLLDAPELGGVGPSFVSVDRLDARYALRMREAVAEPSREAVIDRVRSLADAAGLEVVSLGGLYDLQAQLGRLIASSLRIGIGGLLLLFVVVAAVVARSAATTVRMWVCLAAIPLVVLGTFGHLGIAVDIITSPAANISLAMGVDAMIHLVVRVRRLEAAGAAQPWLEGLRQIRAPILAATGTIAAGFGIFVLSSFPPTRRFGLAVILGTASAAVMALLVLPRLAAGQRPSASSTQSMSVP